MKKEQGLGNSVLKLTVSKIMALLITLLSGMLLSRFRTLEEYGTYSQLMLITTVATTISVMGLPNCLNYFLVRIEDKEEKSRFLSVYYTANTILGIILGIVLVCLIPVWVSYFSNPILKMYLYFLAVYPWTTIIGSSVENLLVVYEKTEYIIKYRFLNSLFVLCSIIFVQIMQWSFQVYIFMYLLVQIAFTIWIYVVVKKLAQNVQWTIDFALLKKMLVFSLPLGLATTVGTINIELDKLLVGRLLDTEQLAIYTNASKEMPVAIVASSITAVLLPQMTKYLMRKEENKAINLWGHAIRISYAFICFIAMLLFVFSSEVIEILYSEKYLPGEPVFRIYCLLLPLRCTYWGMVLNAVGKTSSIFYSSIGALVLNFILNLVLYRNMGVIGFAIATVLTQFGMAFFQLMMTKRVLKVQWKNILPWRAIVIITVLNVVLGVTLSLLQESIFLNLHIHNLVGVICLGLLGCGVYCLILFKWFIKSWKNLKVESD